MTLRQIARKYFDDVVVTFCKEHHRWEWIDLVEKKGGVFPPTLSKEEVERRLMEKYRCPFCDSVHAYFRFVEIP